MPPLESAPMDYKYTSIDEERRERGRPWKWQIIAAVLIAAISSMTTVGIMTTFSVISTSNAISTPSVKTSNEVETKVKPPPQFSCGETLDEAHQRGCTFDALTLTWLHPKCSHFGQKEYLEQSKSSNSSWSYWEDNKGVNELGGHEAMSYLSPGTSYYMTQEAHFYHCVWMLWRVWDAATTPGVLLDSKASSTEHNAHCLEMLVEQAKIGAGDQLSQLIVEGHLLDIGWNAC